jgi:hypothetical protein
MRLIRSLCIGSLLLAFWACGNDGASPSPVTNPSTEARVADATAVDGGDGGGATANEGAVERSGTRLKLSYLAASDGFKTRQIGVYDSQLGIDCNGATASDDVYRCLPFNNADGEKFSDPGCTQRVAIWEACAPKPKYAVRQASSNACTENQVAIYEVGAEIAGATIYMGTPGNCSKANYVADDKAAAMTEIPPATFAAIDRVTRPLAPGLDATYFDGSDGLHALARLNDTKHGSLPCNFSLAMDSQPRCLPVSNSTVGLYWGDTECKNDVVLNVCPPTPIATKYVRGCPYHYQLFGVGAELKLDAAVFAQSSGGCLGVPAAQNQMRYAVTGEIPPTEFVAATPTTSPSGTRLTIDTFDVGTIRIAPPSIQAPLNDTTLGIKCVARIAADGKIRCIEASDARVTYFGDDKCTIPIASNFKTTCAVAKFAERQLDGVCGDKVAVHHVLTKRASAIAYARSTTGPDCNPIDLSSSVDLYDIGPEVPPTDFMELTTTHD